MPPANPCRWPVWGHTGGQPTTCPTSLCAHPVCTPHPRPARPDAHGCKPPDSLVWGALSLSLRRQGAGITGGGQHMPGAHVVLPDVALLPPCGTRPDVARHGQTWPDMARHGQTWGGCMETAGPSIGRTRLILRRRTHRLQTKRWRAPSGDGSRTPPKHKTLASSTNMRCHGQARRHTPCTGGAPDPTARLPP